MKDAYYFPHDCNAHRDPKLAALIQEFGMAGYGIWWTLIEIMHEQGGKIEKFPKLYEGLSQIMSHDEAQTKQNEAMLKQLVFASISQFSLLKEDDTHIWSDRVLRNFKEREDKRAKRVDAGRIGGIISGKSRLKTKQNEALLQANEANEAKERKGNKRIKEEEPPTPQGGIDVPQDLKEHEKELLAWVEYKKQRKQAYKPIGLNQFWERVRKIPADKRRESIEWSMSNNWSGLFEKNTNGHKEEKSDAWKY